MIDAVNRVPAIAGNQLVEHHPDLKERHSGLLVADDPQRGTFAERDLAANGIVPLPFRAEKCLSMMMYASAFSRSRKYLRTLLLPIVDAGIATATEFGAC